MSLRINETISDLTVETDLGTFSLHEWIGDSWAIVFSHPKDFTPVCTTEFGAVAQLKDEWDKRGVKVIGVSVDGVEEHKGWKKDIKTAGGADPEFPIIADSDLAVSKAFGMLPAEAYLPDSTYAQRHRDRARGLHHRTGQDAEALDDLSDERLPQLRRGAARARRAANRGDPHRRDARQLECRRRCRDPRDGQRRGRTREVRSIPDGSSLPADDKASGLRPVRTRI